MKENDNFTKTDAGEIYNDIITALEQTVGEPLYPGDERRIFGEGLVAVMVALFHELNDVAKQRMLRWARGTVLDALGYRTGTERLQPVPAKTLLRFSVSNPQEQNIVIPKGTRATPEGEVYFETTQAAVLQAGASFAQVPAQSAKGGAEYNGYAPGTINTLVDLVPYIVGVSNIDASHGGDDGEPYTTQGDERYRERIRLSAAKRSTAGPRSAYEYWALSADPEIADVKISTPQAGKVKIIPLMKGGAIPDEDVLAAVCAACSPDHVRPMCDYLMVEAPKTVPYDIHIKYYAKAGQETEIIHAIEGPGGAIEQYNQWQTGSIGRDINPDQLRRFILCPNWESGLAGADRVDVTAPVFTAVDDDSVAQFSGSLTVSHEVILE